MERSSELCVREGENRGSREAGRGRGGSTAGKAIPLKGGRKKKKPS